MNKPALSITGDYSINLSHTSRKKLFPNELLNLYHWALGETTFSKVRMNAGWSLPWRRWPYFYNGQDPTPLRTETPVAGGPTGTC